MNILLLTIPVALALGLFFLIAFLWALRTGQFEDLDGAAHRVLLDDDVGEDDENKPDFLKD
ncbi:MAG: cbb3-type cytochrome oxidase assembly protein CcoS [Hyphomicrobiales bacterium]